jgi:ATPase subunit of ABC transporter with duplicated ATPase domains
LKGDRFVAEPPRERTSLRMVNIEKYFGSVCALKNINFEVGHNEIVGLIGDNGAGKSTLVKILTGVFPPRPRPRASSSPAAATPCRASRQSTSTRASDMPVLTSIKAAT